MFLKICKNKFWKIHASDSFSQSLCFRLRRPLWAVSAWMSSQSICVHNFCESFQNWITLICWTYTCSMTASFRQHSDNHACSIFSFQDRRRTLRCIYNPSAEICRSVQLFPNFDSTCLKSEKKFTCHCNPKVPTSALDHTCCCNAFNAVVHLLAEITQISPAVSPWFPKKHNNKTQNCTKLQI